MDRVSRIVLVCAVTVIVITGAIMIWQLSIQSPYDNREGGNLSHDQKWYRYCEELARRGAAGYDVEEQYKVCDQIAECQSHPNAAAPLEGIFGDPCVPKGDPPPLSRPTALQFTKAAETNTEQPAQQWFCEGCGAKLI